MEPMEGMIGIASMPRNGRWARKIRGQNSFRGKDSYPYKDLRVSCTTPSASSCYSNLQKGTEGTVRDCSRSQEEYLDRRINPFPNIHIA